MPKKTLTLILELGCHFLIQVKGNCNKLFAQINCSPPYVTHFRCVKRLKKDTWQAGAPKGRIVFNQVDLPQGWAGIQRIVRVKRWGNEKVNPLSIPLITSLSKPIDSAHVVAKGIRGHWGIENRLHWTKDVLIGEDDMTITNTNSATVVAFLNTTALNLLQLAGYKPIKDTFAKFANKVNELYNLFAF
ncbi:MAG: ISAs1 family transposase [Saprospirales bacterium]|nr:ISAs1 family transposase [Saprospirales bacterium]